MDRKKFITGLMALGTLPAGTLLVPAQAQPNGAPDAKDKPADWRYTADEITNAGADFFGITTEAMAKGVQHVFGDLGQPDAYIKGDEGSGAFVVGVRYGSGWLVRKTREPQQVYWKGPSVGFDFGGNASKCFTLVYNLREDRRLFQRYRQTLAQRFVKHLVTCLICNFTEDDRVLVRQRNRAARVEVTR